MIGNGAPRTRTDAPVQSAKKMTANTFVQIAGKVLRIPLRLLINAALARYLHQEGYGQYSLIMAVVILLTLFVDLGMDDIVVREISTAWQKFNDLFLNIIVFKSLLAVGAVAVGALVVAILGYAHEVRVAAFFASLMLFCNVFSSIGMMVNRAQLEMKYTVLADLVTETVFLGMVVFVAKIHASLLLIILCWLSSRLVHGACMFGLVVRRYRPRPGRLSVRPMLGLARQSMAIWFSQLMAVSYSYVGMIMLSKFAGEQSVGLYNAAFSLIQQAIFVPVAIMHSVFPVMCRCFYEDKAKAERLYRKAIDVMLVLALPMAVLVTNYAREIIVFIYGAEFEASAGALRILIWGAALMFVSAVMPFTFIASQQQRHIVYFGIIGVGLNLILNAILIPRYGYLGVSIATVGTEFAVLSITILFLVRLLGYTPSATVLAKTSLASALFGFILWKGRAYSPVLSVLAGIAVFVALFFLLRIFSKRELLTALGRMPEPAKESPAPGG